MTSFSHLQPILNANCIYNYCILGDQNLSTTLHTKSQNAGQMKKLLAELKKKTVKQFQESL
jgi:hypothetical protein